jgi:hypothetical protein
MIKYWVDIKALKQGEEVSIGDDDIILEVDNYDSYIHISILRFVANN